MKSEWWDQSFVQTYSSFARIFTRVLVCAILSRIALYFCFDYNLLGYSQIEGFIFIAFLLFISAMLKNGSIIIKQVYLYAMIEVINIFLKLNSMSFFPEEKTLLILESTLLTILFQTKIFENIYINAFIILKHIILWHFWTDIDYKFSQIIPTAIGMCIVIFGLWILFEINKRNYIKENFLAKEEIKKSNNRVTEFLRLFSDGLLIMSRGFDVKYSNDTIDAILKPEDKDYISKLKAIIMNDGDCSIFEKLSRVEWKITNSAASIGVSNIDCYLYEWTLKISNWGDEPCYMIKVKDVTKLLSVERMAAENRSKRELIRSVSHELRTPINAISLIVDEICNNVSEDLKEKLSMIKSCVWLLNCHVSDILDYSELVSGKFILNPTNYNLKESLVKCTELFFVQSTHKGVELVTKIDPTIPDVCTADEFRVQKVVTNLLSNAIKYTNKGTVELCAINTGLGVDISVKDTGIGIHQDRLALIFDLFSENQNGMSSGMSGLGLHISNNILKLAGTTLKITSKLGEGSIFTFHLEAFREIPNYQLSSEIDIPYELLGKTYLPKSLVGEKIYPRILIADDNEFNRLTLGNILKRYYISFIEAFNGEVAVQIISEYDKSKFPISCIIMDCNMPVMDGWEATKRIISMYNQGLLNFLPTIIGHTAYSSKEDILRCYDSGMTTHFLKPTTEQQFLSIIRNYI